MRSIRSSCKAQDDSLDEARQRLIELLSYKTHRRTYKTRTDVFLALVKQLEEEGNFPDADYVFDHGVLSRPLEKFAFAEGHVTCGQRLKAIAREVFRTVLTFARQLFEEGKSCQHVLEILMPA